MEESTYIFLESYQAASASAASADSSSGVLEISPAWGSAAESSAML